MRCDIGKWALLALLALGACGELPHPFAHTEPVLGNPLIEAGDAFDLEVAPVTGLPDAARDALAQRLALRLQRAEVAASADPGIVGRYRLSGEAERLAEAGTGEPFALFHWTVTAKSGRVVGAFDQKLKGDPAGWEEADPALIKAVADDVAKSIARLVLADARARAPAARALDPVFVLKPVAGAPGDGGAALDRSLAHALRRAGARIAADASGAGAIVEGNVTLGAPGEGGRLLEIRWRVTRPDGSEIGRLTQANKVAAERLERPWGDLAYIIAFAAAPALMEMLNEAGMESP